MKIICLLTGILISIIQSVALGQTFNEYSEYKPDHSNIDIKIDSFNVSEAFKLSTSSILIFGRSTNLFQSSIGIIQYDILKNVMIYKDFCKGDESFFKPHLFKIDGKNDPVLLLCNVGADYSWGVLIYSIKNDKIKKIGYIDVSLKADENEYDDPVPYAKITRYGKTSTISFTREVATDWQNDNMKLYDPGKITYEIKRNHIDINYR